MEVKYEAARARGQNQITGWFVLEVGRVRTRPTFLFASHPHSDHETGELETDPPS